MMLRLVLVGMVAALGVSIPGKPSCEHWFDSAEAWATTLLAEWDTWGADRGSGVYFAGDAGSQGNANSAGSPECESRRML